MNTQTAFLDLAQPAHRQTVADDLAATGPEAWARLQQAFLRRIDAYLEEELTQPAEHMIASHEAGGAWRIAFPHYGVRGDDRLPRHMADVMAARRRYSDATYYHGFPDEAEVHHEIETFIYFQIPLAFLGRDGSDAARASVEDVAHHVGNWAPEVPEWYDWAAHGFRSTWLGTRNVRGHAPFDYQEANHFRFLSTALTMYVLNGQERYLQVAVDAAETWCRHIEAAPEGGPITCAILPAGAQSEELGHAGKATDTSRYQIFYSTVAPNTAYEVTNGLFDLYRLTGEARYLHCARRMLDQFYAHADGARPAIAYRGDAWQHSDMSMELDAQTAISQPGAMLVRPALRHDLISGEARYARPLLDWTRAIDERRYATDQTAMDLLIAAHWYTGDPAYLARAYAMDLATWAVAEQNPTEHQCDSRGRYGSKFVLELSYQPLLGGVDWGTRAGLPVPLFQHRTAGRGGLPEGLALRIWRDGGESASLEATNGASSVAEWTVYSAVPGRALESATMDGIPAAADGDGYRLRVAPGQSLTGRLAWAADGAGTGSH